MYEPIPSSDLDSTSKESLLDSESIKTYRPNHKNRFSRIFQLILLVSVGLNITLFLHIFRNRTNKVVVEVSRFGS